MKQLLLIRHGKAEPHHSSVTDFERRLTRRGHQDAPEMANRFIEKGILPERIVSSPANRALTTAKHFAKTWNIGKENLHTENVIYEAGTPDLLNVVNNLDNGYERIALFGHNPGFTDFANYLSDAEIHDIPTSGLVWIEFPFDEWAAVRRATGTLLLFDYPRDREE